MKNELILPACLASLCLAGSAHAAASLVVLDDDFETPDYDSFSFNGSDSSSNPDDMSFVSSVSSATGGDPDGRLVVTHTHSVDRDGFGEPINGDSAVDLQSFFSNQSISYTPGTSGEIHSITFSLDVKTTDLFSSLFFEVSDSGGGSVAGGGSGFLSISSDGEWDTYSITVEQSDVAGRDFAGSDPLNFGFGFTSYEDVFFEDIDYSLDVDNFMVTVTPVPEPGSLAILLGGVGLLARRRKP